jgi:hypothetical protein
MSLNDLLTIDASKVSLVGLLIIAVSMVALAFTKGWVVPGYIYVKTLEDCEKMTRLAFRNVDLAERSVTMAEKIKGE